MYNYTLFFVKHINFPNNELLAVSHVYGASLFNPTSVALKTSTSAAPFFGFLQISSINCLSETFHDISLSMTVAVCNVTYPLYRVPDSGGVAVLGEFFSFII